MPTPENVVAKMLQLAKVVPDDVVYDLGSGDGRIVIAAARRHGARGVGVDIDPLRVKEARANARKAGVAARVKFQEGDLFKADIGKASVVTLYLLPTLNLRLRPKLLAELRAGTRIVSYGFDMGDWKPAAAHEVGSSTARRDSGVSSSAGSIAPPNMRRVCSCWRRISSPNWRREISIPFTMATVSRPPPNCV